MKLNNHGWGIMPFFAYVFIILVTLFISAGKIEALAMSLQK